jgi:hypothetical protein
MAHAHTGEASVGNKVGETHLDRGGLIGLS